MALNPEIAFSADSPWCQMEQIKSTKVDLDEVSLGPKTFPLSASRVSHFHFRGLKQVTSNGRNLSVTWGGNFTMLMSSDIAIKITFIDT